MKIYDSLEQRLQRIIMITVSGVLILSAIAFIFFNIQSINEGEDRQLAAISKVLSFNLASPLAFHDKKEVENNLSALDGQNIVKGAIVLDNSGRLVAKYGSGVKEIKEFPNTANQFISIDINSGNDKTGTLLLLHDATQQYAIYKSFAALVFIILLITFAFGYLTSYLTLKPVASYFSELSKVMRSIAEGDYSARVQSNLDIDIKDLRLLASELDRMLGLIESRDKAIRETNEGLEQKIYERTLQLEKQKAQQLETAKMAALGEMAGGVAHEINTPLATIVLAAQMVQENMAEEADKKFVLARVATIEKMGMRISQIVKALRYVSREGKDDTFKPAAISNILQETFELCREKLKVNQIDLIIGNFSPKITIECREVQIAQVLINLINNATDAVASLPQKWIKVSVVENQHDIEIQVSDSGPGIPENVQKKIFDPFFTTKEIGKGTGIGLSITKSIIESHRGQIFIDNKNSNTTFVVSLPKNQTASKAA